MDEFEVQLDDATAFLNRSQSDFGKIKAFPGVEYAELDFGIKLRDSYTHSDVLPSKFLQAVAQSGVSIALTHYRTDDAEQTDQVNLASAEDGH